MHPQDMSDEDMAEVILESLVEDGRINTDFVEVECARGRPVITGRVGSDEELQAIDEILSDVLDFHDYENNVWVDDSLAFDQGEEEEEESGSGPTLEEGEENPDADETYPPDDEDEEK